ncbi:flavin-containing monooxygenase [Nocardia brasiliensis]|uniref:flavin-containing monooxygenase n=1 Tax=Nocardia brasiliensis TaxID=37326 RepID=UPI0024586273|nr:NAD(P)/FAD-dependent oxidoreductase [Nocardia brasiliensis]
MTTTTPETTAPTALPCAATATAAPASLTRGTARIPHYEVVIIGAGFGGIGMGVALEQDGIHDFVILEKAGALGGVWRDNTYPGCNCDVPAHLYSFSFAPYRSHIVRYPGQRDILAYLHTVAAEHGLAPHLRFNTELSDATYLDTTGSWWLTTTSGHHLIAHTVVFALGQLHRPNIPDIPGRHEFTGPAFHTARWNHHHNLHGREVAIIGTGSSAAQLLPVLAATAKRVRVFQRTPHWVLPKPALRFGPVTRTLLRLPGAHQLYRGALALGADTVLAPVMHRGWSARLIESAARRYLEHRVTDPALRADLTPDYPIGGKRIILDSHYYQALTRPNVELITAPITTITSNSIQTGDSRNHHADTIIYATGFRATEFLAPVTVQGRRGRLLHHDWQSGATAHLGVAVPGYPNLFMIAGPNGFSPAGSNPAMKEHEIGMILRSLRWRETINAAAIDVTPAAMAESQQRLDQALARTVWSSTASWYRHVGGRITNPWPGTIRSYGRALSGSPAEWFEPVPIGRKAVSSSSLATPGSPRSAYRCSVGGLDTVSSSVSTQ